MTTQSQFGLSEFNNRCLLTPSIDVPAASILAAYSAGVALGYPGLIVVLSNFTNQMVAYSFDGGYTTTGYLSAGQILTLNFKTNKIPLSAQCLITFKATGTLPTTGLCSVTNFSVA